MRGYPGINCKLLLMPTRDPDKLTDWMLILGGKQVSGGSGSGGSGGDGGAGASHQNMEKGAYKLSSVWFNRGNTPLKKNERQALLFCLFKIKGTSMEAAAAAARFVPNHPVRKGNVGL